MPATNEAKPPTSPTAKANITIATAFWLTCLLVALFWVSKGQKVEAEHTTPSGFVESPHTTLARNNMVRFKQTAPRQDLMLRLVPGGGKLPTELTVFLSSEWKGQSPNTQQALIKTWTSLWSQAARTDSSASVNPQLHFRSTNRSIHSWGG